jgi:hypothetical protein
VRERGEGRIVCPTVVKIEEIGLMMAGDKKTERWHEEIVKDNWWKLR